MVNESVGGRKTQRGKKVTRKEGSTWLWYVKPEELGSGPSSVINLARDLE